MKRREFFKLSFAAASAMGVNIIPHHLLAQTASNKKLVFVFLRGGADVLSLFPPKVSAETAANYLKHPLAAWRGRTEAAARHFLFNTTVGTTVTPAALAISGLPTLAHPALLPVKSLLESDDFALLLHTGSLNETRSHFEQMDYIESGSTTRKFNSGFLARAGHLSVQGGRKSPIAIGKMGPRSMLGLDVPVIERVQDLRGGYEVANGRVDGKALGRSVRLEAFKTVSSTTHPNNTRSQMVDAAKATYDNLQVETEAFVETATVEFGRACELAAALTKVSHNPPIMTIDHNGWDHHFAANPTDPAGTFASRAAELANGLNTLYTQCSPETVIVVMSEFGRTVVNNASMGTDHGRGGAMMVFGKPVSRSRAAGKLAAQWDLTPDPATNFVPTNASAALAVNLDYREVIGEVLQKHLGIALSSNVELAADTSIKTVFDGLTQINPKGFV